MIESVTPIGATRPRLSLTEALDLQCRAKTARRIAGSAWPIYILALNAIGLFFILSSKLIRSLDSAVPFYLDVCYGASMLLVVLLFALLYGAARCYKKLASGTLTEAREVILAAEMADATQSSPLA